LHSLSFFFLITCRPLISTLFPYTTLFRSEIDRRQRVIGAAIVGLDTAKGVPVPTSQLLPFFLAARSAVKAGQDLLGEALSSSYEDRKSTRLNSSHVSISYAVFCLKKKNKK